MSQPDKPGTLSSIIAKIPTGAPQPFLKGIDARLQMRATSEQPEEWVLTIKDSIVTAERGTADKPNLTLEAAPNVWEGLRSGKLDGAWAYMSGQLRVSGDLGLAMRLQSLISGL